MGKYIIKKVIQAVAVMLIVTFISFLLVEIMPGDAAVIYLGTDAADPVLLAETRAKLNLDKPLPIQWFLWVRNAIQGDFGNSFYYKMPVSEMIGDRIGITFSHGIVALIFSVVVGLFLGIWAATHQNKFWDNFINVLANIGISAPSFWMSIVFIYIFAMALKILPVQGYVPPSADFKQSLIHMIGPCFIMSLGSIATITRQTRASVLDVLNEDYVRTARSKGLKGRVILIKHVLKNALIPVLTVLGISIASLFGGSVMVEQIFNIPGMGQLVNTAVLNRDIPVIQAYIVIISLVIILSSLVVDIAYGIVDPRIRTTGGEKK